MAAITPETFAPKTDWDVLTPPSAVTPDLAADAARHNIYYNMLMFPHPWYGDADFATDGAEGWERSNIPNVVADLKELGYDAAPLKAARDWRERVLPALFRFFADAKYKGVEVVVGPVPADAGGELSAETVGQLTALRKAAEGCGLGLTAVGMAAGGADFVPSLLRQLRAAHHLGSAKLSGPLALSFKEFPAGLYGARLAAWVRAEQARRAELIRKDVAPVAKKLKVALYVEALQRFELPGLTTNEQTLRFCEAVGEPAVARVMFDACHTHCGDPGWARFGEVVRRAMGLFGDIHVHYSAIDRQDLEQTCLDFDSFTRPINAAGYRGPRVIEIFDGVRPFDEAVNIYVKFRHPLGIVVRSLVALTRRLNAVGA
jgi:sugar phosphate isomerase/epimerase